MPYPTETASEQVPPPSPRIVATSDGQTMSIPEPDSPAASPIPEATDEDADTISGSRADGAKSISFRNATGEVVEGHHGTEDDIGLDELGMD